jgi:carboxymethylenebutenolidase
METMKERYDTISTADGPMGVYIVHPDGDGPFPVVVSFHHGPGLEQESKDAMAIIAGWGYYVISHDRYHREGEWIIFQGATASDEARKAFFKMLLGTTEDMVAADLQATLDYVAGDPIARSGSMGCIGYCIGARSVLRTLADAPDQFRVGIALHPSFCTTDGDDSPHLGVKDFDGWLYVGFGSEDKMQPVDDNKPFIDLVKALPHGEVEIHEGADHGYGVPGRGDKAAFDRSYMRAKAMFEEGLQP